MRSFIGVVAIAAVMASIGASQAGAQSLGTDPSKFNQLYDAALAKKDVAFMEAICAADLKMTLNDQVILVHENEAVYLPIGSRHRLTNPGKIPLELIEVQTGSYLGEDDIVRIEDVYQRS